MVNLRFSDSRYWPWAPKHQEHKKNKASDCQSVWEGSLIALYNTDEVIKASVLAKDKCRAEGWLDLVQWDSVPGNLCDMRLGRLRVWNEKIDELKHNELCKKIAYYKSILADEHKPMGDESSKIKQKYGDGRRIKNHAARWYGIDEEYLSVDEEDAAVTPGHLGYSENTYKAQRRKGKRCRSQQPETWLCGDHYVDTRPFTTSVFIKIKAETPEASRTAKGTVILTSWTLGSGRRVIPVKGICR